MKRILLFFLLFGFFCFVYFDRYQPISLDAIHPTTKTVEIKGAVNRPGVYTVKWEANVQDVIQLAGGLQEMANTDSLSLLENVKDGDVLVIAEESKEIQKISINTATVEELDRLPGIGPSIANRIIEYRQKQRFRTLEELKEVKGIGDKLFEKIKEQIVL